MRPPDIALLRWPQDPQLSFDATELAWFEVSLDIERDEPVSSIYVGTTDGSSPARQFTEGPHDFSPRWSPDGRYMAFLSASDAPPVLKLAPLSGGAPVTVESPGPVNWIEWSPEGDRLILVVNTGASKDTSDAENARSKNAPRVIRGLFNRLDGAGWLEGRDHLFVYDVEKKNLRQLTSGDFDHAQPSWSPDGSSIAFVSDRSRHRNDRHSLGELWTIGAGRRQAPRRVAGDVADAAFPTFSPDGSRIAFAGMLGADRLAGRDVKLLVVDADGSSAPELVAPGLDRPVGFTLAQKPFSWLSPDELAFTVADGGAVDIRRARLGERSARIVVGGDRQVTGISVSATGERPVLAFGSAWIDSPPEIYTLELERRGRRPVRVSTAGDALLKVVTLLPAERLHATAPDGLEIEYLVIRPKAERPRKRGSASRPPLFLEIHGGPHLHNPMCELLTHYQGIAGAGYAVVLPNPRGSTGYGEHFTGLARGDWGEGPFLDVLACADDAIERGLADEKRQFIGGYSYGGYLSSWAVGHTKRFRAASIGAPVVNHVSLFGTWDGGSYLADALAGDPWSAQDHVRAQSPIAYAPAFDTPVLLYVNDGDLRCPPSQSDELYAALKWYRREVEYVRYPGGSHLSALPTLGPPSQNEDRLRRILDWCAGHGGVPAS
jgi:dipeptidyl aminopeptidase/acylaminoacyl peptidase